MLKVLLKMAVRYYVFAAIVCVLAFNWQYAQNSGTSNWLKFGLVRSTGKALVWPFFYKSTLGKLIWTKEEVANASHFLTSSELDIKASQMINQGIGTPGALEDYKLLRKRAFNEAIQVRDEVLEKALEGMSRPYHDLFQKSIELQLKAMNTQDAQAETEGAALHNQWVEWITANGAKMKIPSFGVL